jgi:hypothetical protein
MFRTRCEPTAIRNRLLGLGLVTASVLALTVEPLLAEDRPHEVAIASFDAAPFGMIDQQPDATAFGVRWGTTRKVRAAVVEFAEGAAIPPADKLRVQYWHKHWDGKADPIVRYSPSALGWTPMDDWTNGQWKDADAKVSIDGRRVTFVFASSGAKEFPKRGSPGAPYRKTLKVRVVADRPLPKIARFQALTISERRPLTVRLLWGAPACAQIKAPEADPCRLEVFNGQVRAVRATAGSNFTVASDGTWTLPAGAQGGIEVDLVMATQREGDSSDATIVTVRSKFRPFSFSVADVAAGGRVLVDDLGVLIVRGDDPVTLESHRQALRAFPDRSVYDRVFEMPEQTLERAWNDMPLKRPLWFVHGLPGNRNAVRHDPNGGIAIAGHTEAFRLDRSPRDCDRKLWDGPMLGIDFGLPADALRAGRELRDGYLPLLRTWWVDGPLYYEQRAMLDKLDADLTKVRLDDPTVLLVKVRVVNISTAETAKASLRLSSRSARGEGLYLDKDLVMARHGDGGRLRCLVRGAAGDLVKEGDALRWSKELAPGAAHEVEFLLPTITLDELAEIDALRKRDVEADFRRVCRFWEELTARGAQITTPEPWLNGFYKSVLRHLEVNCVKDTKTNCRYARVGTFSYKLFPNESIMMVSDLDRRGAHQAAADCLDAWIAYQGTVPLPGNFKSTDGLFYGSAGYEHVGYNKHHGYVMWGMAEHWWLTRDKTWMARVAPHLVKACDWVIRERQATMTRRPDGSRPIEYGFLPAGGLEDVQDYWYWVATNAATVWAFDALAAALADYGHPEAPRLQKEARAYHDDVMRAITEARVRTPVVRLRDGTYVPKFPSRLYERGRSLGWIRETLEGSLCLLVLGLIPPDSPEATWIVKDYEDNLYISDTYGYDIPNFAQFWFSRGGFSMQANLLEGPVPYLARDQIKHFLRAYFNGFASAFYPEIRMCNEHSKPELGYPVGDHFKSSDEANVTYWLRLMFVREQGHDLYLGQGIPRYWLASGRSVGIERAATHFGSMSLTISSNADESQIKAVLVPPERNRPKSIYVRLRHPQGKPIQGVTLNGTKHDRFDVDKEWIILPGTLTGVQEVLARY